MEFDVSYGGVPLGRAEIDVPACLDIKPIEADLVEEIILGLGIPSWLFKSAPPVPLLVLPHLSFPQEGV